MPIAPVAASEDANGTIGIFRARLDHRGKENVTAYPASVDGRAGERGELRQISLAILFRVTQMVDVIRFERRIGREVESAFSGHEGNCAGLLVALQDDIDLAEVVRSPNDAAFVAVIAGEHPETFSLRVVHDVVDVANRTLGECVGDIPRRSTVFGDIDVNFVAGGIVEI